MSSTSTVSIDEMAKAIVEHLEDYQNLASDELKKAVKRAGQTVKDEIKANAPRKTGRYAESWVVNKISETGTSIELVVHSPKRYMLAHLLENGHAKRGGGRVEGKPHIKPAEEKGIKQLEDDINAAL